MCRDNIYLIPYLYPEKYIRALQGRFCSSHKQSRCCEAGRQTDAVPVQFGGEQRGLGMGGGSNKGRLSRAEDLA